MCSTMCVWKSNKQEQKRIRLQNALFFAAEEKCIKFMRKLQIGENQDFLSRSVAVHTKDPVKWIH